MDSGLPRADEIISLNEAEALMQANLSSEFNKVVDDIGNALNKKITDLFDDKEKKEGNGGMRQYYIDKITFFIEKKLIDPKTTKQINKILALQTPAFQYKNEGKNTQQPTIIGRDPKMIGRGRTSSSTRKRAKKGKRFNKTQKQHGGDYGLLTGVIEGPMKRLEKVVTDKLSTYHIENAIGTGFYRAMGQAAFDENKLNCAVDKMLKEELKTSEPDELNTCNPSKYKANNYKAFKNALIQARCPNR